MVMRDPCFAMKIDHRLSTLRKIQLKKKIKYRYLYSISNTMPDFSKIKQQRIPLNTTFI